MILQYNISIPGVNAIRRHSNEFPKACVGWPTVFETLITLEGIVS